MLFGWTLARFGLLGSKPQVPTYETLNYIGVVIATLSAVFYVIVKPEVRGNKSFIITIVIQHQLT